MLCVIYEKNKNPDWGWKNLPHREIRNLTSVLPSALGAQYVTITLYSASGRRVSLNESPSTRTFNLSSTKPGIWQGQTKVKVRPSLRKSIAYTVRFSLISYTICLS